MLSDNILDSFSKILTQWYHINKRDLPWRQTQNPYKIWLSEIILQQTRVAQGRQYYERFVEKYPTVELLAKAEEEAVLKLWQGLGYYSRARNIHTTAKIIADNYQGKFPTNYTDVIKLKGIGEYTAAAICSFAYNQPYAVVDGNVFRVLSRVFGIDTPIDSTQGKKDFTVLASTLLDKKQPATHNQAIMEFGALQCVPGLPNCDACPLQTFCLAYKSNLIKELPIKSLKTKQRDRFFNYICILNGDKTYVQKREGKDVWMNLYEFPLIETETDVDFESLIQTNAYKNITAGFNEIEIISDTFSVKHILSHQKIHTKFYTLKTNMGNKTIIPYVLISFNKLYKLPVSRLTELFLSSFNDKTEK